MIGRSASISSLWLVPVALWFGACSSTTSPEGDDNAVTGAGGANDPQSTSTAEDAPGAGAQPGGGAGSDEPIEPSGMGGVSGGPGPSTVGPANGGMTSSAGAGGSSTSAGGTGGVPDDDGPSSTMGGGAGQGPTTGDAGSGGMAMGGAANDEPDDDAPPGRPQGVVPNDPQPADVVDLPRDRWADGLISPTLESEHHNQPAIVNGYLYLVGNARFSVYDISDPTDPEQLSVSVSPDNCPNCGPKGEGEAEGHQVGFARYGNRLYAATISGRGIDIWDITEPDEPQHLKSVHLEGVDFGDFTEAVWGVYWQGSTIYVGGTNTGLHVLDATDPADVTVVRRVPTSSLGGVSAGPVFAVGNILVITTPKESGGIATLDISDPHNPLVLDAITTSASYIGAFYRKHVYLQSPLRVWDVLSDPTTIGSANSPLGTLNTPDSEYMSFSDDYMFLGLLRPNPGAEKINVSNPASMQVERRIWGRMNISENDDQFTVAVGNLLVLSDDQLLPTGGGYSGSVIAVHDTDPDTQPPRVDTVIPKPGATGQSTQSRIGISFSDNIELATVDSRAFIVRPVGGEPVSGVWGVYTTLLNFDPDEELLPETTYEVVLPAGRITDYVGNALEEDFVSTFTTR